MDHPPLLAAVITSALVGIAALWDLKTGRIPNYVTFTAICLGLALSGLEGGFEGFRDSISGLVAGGAFLIVPFALGGIGPGDVKLLAAVGALNGFAFVVRAFLYTAVAGGLIAGAVAASLYAAAGGGMSGLVSGFRSRGNAPLRQAFPYALAIMAGTVAAYAVR